MVRKRVRAIIFLTIIVVGLIGLSITYVMGRSVQSVESNDLLPTVNKKETNEIAKTVGTSRKRTPTPEPTQEPTPEPTPVPELPKAGDAAPSNNLLIVTGLVGTLLIIMSSLFIFRRRAEARIK